VKLRVVLYSLLVVIAFGGGLLVGRTLLKPSGEAPGEKPDAPEAKPQVRIAKASRAKLDSRLVCFGTAAARPQNERIVTARVAATVASVIARKGDSVKTGDVILTLDNRPLEAARRKAEGVLAEAEAELAKADGGNLATELAGFKVALAQAKADLLQSQRTLTRQTELAGQGLVAPRQLEEAQAGSEIARLRMEAATLQVERAEHGVQDEEKARLKARVAQARADLDTARLQESYAQVRAEIDGTLSDLDAVAGQSVDASTPLARVVAPGAVDALLSLPGELVSKVSIGADVRILVGASEVGHAKVEAIAGAVSADGSRTVRASLGDATALVPGTPIAGEISLGQIESVVVPREAVVQDSDRTVVLALVQAPDPDPNEKEPIEVAKKVLVRVVVRDGGLVGIEGDVAEGTEVITGGGYNLPDGTEVEREP
jgi:HlyD family secretion protein